MTIFVSIAAYRDPELAPTIAECVAHARWPERLHFGLCWQHGPDDTPPPVPATGRMRLIDVPWQESLGACWARAQAMTLYDGEDHYLQLDSHHRFAPGWDELLLDQAAATGSPRPLLTTYAPAYDPALPTPLGEPPTGMALDRFTAEGIALFKPCRIPAGRPRHARFVSGHLLFAPGRFVTDVPYDPELYFHGEEISLAVRAFTHGYDLFHPGAVVVWHEYTRKLRAKHWDDHQPGVAVAEPWHARDARSLAKVRHMLEAPEGGTYGYGAARSLADYEAYAGINFRQRFACRAARTGEEPAPSADRLPDLSWTVRLTLDPARLPREALESPMFWYVGFHDAAGTEIVRDDADRAEMGRALAARDGGIVIERRFSTASPPARWTIWPTDRRGRWLERIEGAIAPDAHPARIIAIAA